jgi:hypothetical protein
MPFLFLLDLFFLLSLSLSLLLCSDFTFLISESAWHPRSRFPLLLLCCLVPDHQHECLRQRAGGQERNANGVEKAAQPQTGIAPRERGCLAGTVVLATGLAPIAIPVAMPVASTCCQSGPCSKIHEKAESLSRAHSSARLGPRRQKKSFMMV